MPSPREGEREKEYISRCMSSEEAKRDFPDSKQRVAFCNSKWQNKSKGAYEYEDPKTGELFYYSRRGTYRKNGRMLVFKRTKGRTMSDHIFNRAVQSYADEKAGYPPNCNKGYVEKDGKCVPVEGNNAEWSKDKKKNGDDEEKNGNDKKKNGNDKKKNGNDKKKNGDEKKNPFEKKK